jgi:hypothetical protein
MLLTVDAACLTILLLVDIATCWRGCFLPAPRNSSMRIHGNGATIHALPVRLHHLLLRYPGKSFWCLQGKWR